MHSESECSKHFFYVSWIKIDWCRLDMKSVLWSWIKITHNLIDTLCLWFVALAWTIVKLNCLQSIAWIIQCRYVQWRILYIIRYVGLHLDCILVYFILSPFWCLCILLLGSLNWVPIRHWQPGTAVSIVFHGCTCY